MNARAEAASTGLDTAKLAVAVLLLAGGIWAFYFFAAYSVLLRTLGLLVIASAAAALALTSAQGRQLWRFALDSRMEVRKVVWPTRQETIQTTLVVIVMVFILGLILWLFDTILRTIFNLLVGNGG
ncbi:MAG: preprotein translocase subunit SecE [Lamprobacter sp.]|uniref:preprotein translocase subunit SecE n=1 Tax=Lamprobacter sp. TaxID=3100796 RepID=UPI002B25AC81|nr:preprotein translocase subunit SecE [Lamprobacter sp.]MEA3641999.1 preprotein translocase subunit SecE [Lamprobacter sp.]